MPDTRISINKLSRLDVALFIGNPTADNYQEIAGKSAIYPGKKTPLGLIYCALKLNGEAGEFAEHVGKAMRDDKLLEGVGTGDAFAAGLPMTAQRHDALFKELGDVLWYVAAAAKELGLSLSDVMTGNLEKLADRTERDALRGSGDNR